MTSKEFNTEKKKTPSRAKNKKITAPQPTTDMFTRMCQSKLDVLCVKEYRFHDKRKWRFDYAFPNEKIAIEIDGGVWTLGRHNRPKGYIADLEKFNEAAALGWVVLKFTPQQQYTLKTLAVIQRTIKQRRTEEKI